MKKKSKGGLFEKNINEWTLEDYFLFLSLSETVQKGLPDHKTAGSAKSFVLEHFRQLLASQGATIPAKNNTFHLSDIDPTTMVNRLILLLDVLKHQEAQLRSFPSESTPALDTQICLLYEMVFRLAYPEQNSSFVSHTPSSTLMATNNNNSNNKHHNNVNDGSDAIFLRHESKEAVPPLPIAATDPLPRVALIPFALPSATMVHMAMNIVPNKGSQKEINVHTQADVHSQQKNKNVSDYPQPAILASLGAHSDGEDEDGNGSKDNKEEKAPK